MYVLRENEEEFFTSFEGPFISAVLGPGRVGKTTLVEHMWMHTQKERGVVQYG